MFWPTAPIGRPNRSERAQKHMLITTSRNMSSSLSSWECSIPSISSCIATGEKINITQIEGQFPQAPFPTMEEREDFVKDWIQVPDEKFKQYLLDWEFRGERSNPYYPTVDMSVDIVDWQEMMHYIDDALGMCAGLSSFPLKPPYHIHNYPSLISSATGIDMDEVGLKQIYKQEPKPD